MERAALGFRVHSGWAAVTAAAEVRGRRVVVDRRRIEFADTAIAGSRQPFHAAERLEHGAAEALIGACRESSEGLALGEVQALVAGLAARGYRVSAGGVLFAGGRPLPELAAILRSHALIHTAEGVFFREVVVGACEACSLQVMRVAEREAGERGGAILGSEVDRLMREWGRELGPPWRQDEKLATLAAWIAWATPDRATGGGERGRS